ncbi:hypothetical protein AAG906_004792 [Vitis piasezkii]
MVEAFDTVYKGILPSGSGNSVAEKKLEKVVGEDEKEFKAEVNVKGQTHHKNHEGEHSLLVRRGLVYLHEECSKQIIHCDIKPSEHNSWMILLQPKLQTRTGKASDNQPD